MMGEDTWVALLGAEELQVLKDALVAWVRDHQGGMVPERLLLAVSRELWGLDDLWRSGLDKALSADYTIRG